MKSALRLALLTSFALACTARAHEIKILASKFTAAKAGEKTTIYLSWGHRLPVDDLIDGSSIDRFELVPPDGKPVALKKQDYSLQANAVELPGNGLHQAVVTRKITVYTTVIDGDGNRQLKRGPKTSVIEGKIDHTLRSVQTAKAVIRVGPASAEAVKPLGLDVEIVPLDGPAQWKKDKDIRVQVLVNGKPLAFASVLARTIDFKPDNAWSYATTTNRQGEATLRPNRSGTWVVKVNTKVDATGAALKDYDYTSYTTTLALEIEP